MDLTETRTALKEDLAKDDLTNDELDRGVVKAVSDLSRFLPDEKIAEFTFVLEVTSEAWTSAAVGTVSAVTIVVAGTGYTLGDILTVVGGTGTAAVLKVLAVTGGVITSIGIYTVGAYTVNPTNPVSVTGGSGANATFNLTIVSDGTYVTLANKPIKWDSETIKSSDGVTTYTKDTDYTMDYSNGKITTISTGSMAVATGYLATYTKFREGLDISSLTGLLRVRRVEYPLSTNAIMEFLSFSIWEDILYIAPEQMSDKKHLAVYYDKECTAPTTDTDGSFARYLDEVILKGAGGYILMARGIEAEFAGKTAIDLATTLVATISYTKAEDALDKVATNLDAANTALGKLTSEATAIGTALTAIAGYLTSAGTALDKVTTYNDKVDTSLAGIATHITAATTALDKVATEVAKAGSDAGQDMEGIAAIFTDVDTALDLVATKVGAMETALAELDAMWTDEIGYRTKAETYLTSGDDHINKVNVGDRVADLYGIYAQVHAALARLSENRRTTQMSESTASLSAATAYINEANSRINLIAGHISKARERVNQASAYIAESNSRVTLADRSIGKANAELGVADRFINEANGRVSLADRKLGEATARLGLITSYINEAGARISEANSYIAEASQRVADNELIARQADINMAIGIQQMNLADRFLKDAMERRNEFWSVLKDKQQIRREYSLVAQRQPV